MHRTSRIRPRPGCNRRYSQLYIFEPREAVAERRSNSNNHCDKELLRKLEQDLRRNNPYVQSLRHLDSYARQDIRQGRQVGNISMLLKKDAAMDPNTNNLPSTTDVSVVFRTVDGAPKFEKEIVIHYNNGRMVCISELNPLCDPLSFPLLFSNGGFEWSFENSPSHHYRVLCCRCADGPC